MLPILKTLHSLGTKKLTSLFSFMLTTQRKAIDREARDVLRVTLVYISQHTARLTRGAKLQRKWLSESTSEYLYPLTVLFTQFSRSQQVNASLCANDNGYFTTALSASLDDAVWICDNDSLNRTSSCDVHRSLLVWNFGAWEMAWHFKSLFTANRLHLFVCVFKVATGMIMYKMVKCYKRKIYSFCFVWVLGNWRSQMSNIQCESMPSQCF